MRRLLSLWLGLSFLCPLAIAEVDGTTTEMMIGKYSSVIAKSLSNYGCQSQSYDCRACTQNSRCRFCALKATGSSHLLFESTGNGLERLVGICVDIFDDDWKAPILIIENPPTEAQCGLLAPDYEEGITCFDIESAGKYPRYRQETEKHLPRVLDYSLNQIEEDQLSDYSPQEALIYTFILPGVAILFCCVCTTLLTRLCGLKLICCCPCITCFKLAKCLRRSQTITVDAQSPTAAPWTYTISQIKSPRFDQDLSTTAGSWASLGGSSLGGSSLGGTSSSMGGSSLSGTLANPFEVAPPKDNRSIERDRVIDERLKKNDIDERGGQGTVFEVKIDRNFFESSTPSQTNEKKRNEEKKNEKKEKKRSDIKSSEPSSVSEHQILVEALESILNSQEKRKITKK